MIRLIALDMDGTLLDGLPPRIPAENLRALRMAHERGIHLALCSGRVPDDASFFALDASLPMHILGLNGGCCLDRPLGPILRSAYIPEADTLPIVAMLDAAGIPYGVFRDNDLILSAASISPRDLALCWGSYLTRPGSRCTVRTNREGLQAMLHRGINKIVAAASSDPPQSALLAHLRQEIQSRLPGVDVTSSWVNNLEINPRGVNKGTAVAALAQSLSIPLEQVMAIGDHDNDVPMLQAAGIGVAMANATPSAVAAADYVTLSCSSFGVAAAIDSLALHIHRSEVQALK